MEFFDSHAHYDDEKFNEDREEVIRNIYNSGVTKFVSAGYNLVSSKFGVKLAHKYEYIYTTAGISPNDVEDTIEKTNNSLQELAKIIEQERKQSIENNVKSKI
ncbi:MAG: TatD family hydrolase, partial [Clostridia bacterium]